MAIIDVESAELRQQSQSVLSGASEVDETVRRLTAQINELATRWRGSASDSFKHLWDEWQHGATQLHEGMRGIGNLLEQAATTYEDAEESVKASTGH